MLIPLLTSPSASAPGGQLSASTPESITAWSTLALAVVTLMLVGVTAALAWYA